MHQSPVKCMHNILGSAARSLKKKMHRVSAQNENSRFKQAADKSTDQHVRVRSKIYLRATVQDGVSSIYLQLQIFCKVRTNMAALFLTYIEKMTACNFLSAMKILICYGTAEIYVRLFGIA
jgi:hypothetical protein